MLLPPRIAWTLTYDTEIVEDTEEKRNLIFGIDAGMSDYVHQLALTNAFCFL